MSKIVVSARASGSEVTWQVQGDESTVDHYTVWEGDNPSSLNPLKDVPAGKHSFDLSSYGINPGSGTKVFVQAVGKPSLTNHLSEAVTF